MLFFVIQEWVAIEPYSAVSYSTMAKALADSFRDPYHDLEYISKLFFVKTKSEHTIVGRIYVKAPVSSNIITTTDTVMCMIPESAAAAPKNA